jgi:hypothetical protein
VWCVLRLLGVCVLCWYAVRCVVLYPSMGDSLFHPPFTTCGCLVTPGAPAYIV